MSSVDSIMARLLKLHPRRIDLSLDRIARVLAALGDPHKRLPPIIHVAGTNGKGSTIAFMRAILEAAGLRVHVYTSPNLVRINERYRLGRSGGGVLVSDDELASALNEVERANGDAPITVFEVETAAAFVLFARHPADVALIEVGLGGRLDATNVIERPLASVITPISMDHMDYLGDTLPLIAAEKAAIIKAGAPVVVGRQPPEALDVVEREAARARATMHIAGDRWIVTHEHGRLAYQDDDGLLDLPAPKLFGRHQIDNAGLAIATLRVTSGPKLKPSAYETGLVRAEWPARMQRLAQGRLVGMAPAGSELWIDGGHNPEGGRAIAAALADLEERVSRPVVLIVGMLSTKDASGFLRNFAGLARRIIAVPVPNADKSLSPDTLADAARAAGIPADARDDIETAVRAVGKLALEPPPRILVTGSLYLAGAVLAANETPPM